VVGGLAEMWGELASVVGGLPDAARSMVGGLRDITPWQLGWMVYAVVAGILVGGLGG
jgi:hypothetical protein